MTTRDAPPRCFMILPGQPRGRNVAVCERGQIGVKVTTVDLGDAEAARVTVRVLNAALGVSPAEQREMVSCALHGWARGAGMQFVRAPQRAVLH